jgi:1-acyl-sn-glycerol-3-phosphate acyltransferase
VPETLPLLHRTRAGVRAAALGAVTLSLLGAQALHGRTVPVDERPEVFQRWMRRWARSLIQVFGAEVRVQGEVPPRGAKGRLVIANHRSPVDIAVLLELFGGSVVARADMAKWPVLGIAAREAGTIFVDRQDSASGATAIRAIRNRISEGGSVLVFPEGGTHVGDEVVPFKGGAFAALRGLDVEIVPAGLAYDPGIEFVEESFTAHLARVAARQRTRCAVRIGPPMPPARNARTTALEMQAVVQGLVTEARHDWERW